MRLRNGFETILGQYITWLWATVYVCIIVRLDEREPSETAATQMLLTRPFTNEISPKVEFWSEKLTFVGGLLLVTEKMWLILLILKLQLPTFRGLFLIYQLWPSLKLILQNQWYIKVIKNKQVCQHQFKWASFRQVLKGYCFKKLQKKR